MNSWFNRSLLIREESVDSFYTILGALTDDQITYLLEELRAVAAQLEFDPDVFEKITGEPISGWRQERYDLGEIEEQAYEEHLCQTR